MGDTRRGAPTARAVYGNAASIFAGDWLLIEALRRVERCRLPGVLVDLFETVEVMIFAESLQLEWRGRATTDRSLYFRVVEGKTASLFRWAMRAGGLAGGLAEEERQALADYGGHLGVAFQAVDDLLDLTGDTSSTGKELFADLKEGKMTYPVILALERDPALRPAVEEILAAGSEEPVYDAGAVAAVVAALGETGAMKDCLALAREKSAEAIASLERLPDGRARRALATVAEAIVDRDL
jgi:octaprenyl-diphosphate synthase